MIRFFGVAIFVTFFLNVHCIQAEPKLWVEKNPVTAGESFRMFVEVENEDDPEEPNLSLIKDNGITKLHRKSFLKKSNLI